MSTTEHGAEHTKPKRPWRAEPISKRVSKTGTVTYEFRADVGSKPDGSRDRRRFTYRTYQEARCRRSPPTRRPRAPTRARWR